MGMRENPACGHVVMLTMETAEMLGIQWGGTDMADEDEREDAFDDWLSENENTDVEGRIDGAPFTGTLIYADSDVFTSEDLELDAWYLVFEMSDMYNMQKTPIHLSMEKCPELDLHEAAWTVFG